MGRFLLFVMDGEASGGMLDVWHVGDTLKECLEPLRIERLKLSGHAFMFGANIRIFKWHVFDLDTRAIVALDERSHSDDFSSQHTIPLSNELLIINEDEEGKQKLDALR